MGNKTDSAEAMKQGRRSTRCERQIGLGFQVKNWQKERRMGPDPESNRGHLLPKQVSYRWTIRPQSLLFVEGSSVNFQQVVARSGGFETLLWCIASWKEGATAEAPRRVSHHREHLTIFPFGTCTERHNHIRWGIEDLSKCCKSYCSFKMCYYKAWSVSIVASLL